MALPLRQYTSPAFILALLSLCSVVALLLINGSGKRLPLNEISELFNSEATDDSSFEEHISYNDSIAYTKSAGDTTASTRLLQDLTSDLEQPLPSVEEVVADLDLTGQGADGKVTILMEVAAADILIVLARRNSATEYIPVSRSYDGYDWEAAPGLHQGLSIVCGEVSSARKCQLKLDNSGQDDVYFLTKYSRSVSDQAKVARFLEMATFGPTISEINNFDYSNIDRSMAMFVKDQIENQPINSHREFYRKHLNVRAVETYKHGVTGPKACDRHSRWRSFAFTTKDMQMSQRDQSFAMEIETRTTPSTAHVITFAGFPRTVLYQRPQYYSNERDQTILGSLADGEYPICYVEDIEGSKRLDTPYAYPPTFKVKVNGVCRPVIGGNPTVHLDSSFVVSSTYHELDLTSSTLIPLDTSYSKGSSLLLDNAIVTATCNDIADPQDATHKSFQNDCNNNASPGNCDHYKMNSWRNPTKPVFGKRQDGIYVLYDTRLELDENTIENPLIDGGGNKVVASTFVAETSVFNASPRPAYYCSNAPQDTFNEEHCILSFDPNVCVSFDTAVMNAITFDEHTIQQMFSLTGRYVFAVKGLVFDATIHPDTAVDQDAVVDLPCDPRTRSRWLRLNRATNGDWIRRDESTGACTNSLDITTHSQFESAIFSSTDQNPHFKDVYFRGSCSESDRSKHDMLIYVAEEDQCYQNVHPDYLSIYDMSNWAPSPDDVVNHHPGGSAVIRKWSDSGILVFPAERYAWHTMDRWQEFSTKQERFGKFVARLGDSIKFDDLPAELQTENVANSLGANKLENVIGNSGGTLVCGSQGEIAPDPMEDDYFEINLYDTDTLDTMVEPRSQKQTIWTHFALSAEDQLRQKMAWALSQILVISPSVLTDSRATEPFLVFYDIFVRNGLGNYRDVLKEVTFSVKMGEMLTFKDNRALGYLWHTRKQLQHPDENYARELMQLFTIGLVRLNMDGTEVLDSSGSSMKTYNSKDIVSFARAWTGFTQQPYRGNVEDINSPTKSSYLDPMRIQDIRFRDIFPKRGLDGKFIGDRYPLCSDLPEKAFLKKGAKYKLLGGNPSPKWQRHYGVDWSDPQTKRFIVDSGSALYDTLQCKMVNGMCAYTPVVTLTQNLPCSGNECKVDTVRAVQVGSVFYEYIRTPCVQLAFYEDAKKLSAGRDDNLNMCGNPKLASATEACCGINRDTDKLVFDYPRRADRSCEYRGEKVTYATNAERCYNLGGSPCDLEGFLHWNENSNQDCINDYWSSNNQIWDNIWHWTNAPCSLQVAVKSNGLVALHHNPDKSGHDSPPPNAGHVDVLESLNYFSVHWERNETSDEQFPSVENGCGNGACQIFDDATCLCDTTLSETVAFSSLPTRTEALSQLTIGAFAPDMFDEDQYELVESANGIEAWRKKWYDQKLAPTPSPSGRCHKNLINWNADAETATVEAWHRWGDDAIELQQPGYDSNFALRFHPQGQSGNWRRGIYQYLPTECLSANDGLSVSFKVKLINATDDSPVACNPHTTSQPDACPFIRLEIRNNDISHWIELDGLREWNDGEWNSYSVDFLIPSEYNTITRFRPVIVVGGPSASDGRVLLVDDVEILKDSSIVASEAPSSSPTSSCLYFNMGVNGDAETGMTSPYGSTGTNTSLTVQTDDVFSGKYAFKFKAYKWFRGMNKGVWNMQAPSPGQREGQCISAGTTLQFEFKVKLVNDNGKGFEGLACDPAARTKGGGNIFLTKDGGNSQTDASGCPLVRPSVYSNDRWIGHDVWGIDTWDANNWNSFSARWTVPDYGYPIEKFQVQFAPNRHSEWPNDSVYMLLDDFEYFVVPFTDPPSNSPTLSSFPSIAPTVSPSRVPSQSPTDLPTQFPTEYPDYTSGTIFRVLDEKQEYIYLKNVKSNVQIGSLNTPSAVTCNIRNPPSFYDLSELALRDAYYETDAVIDHLLYHDNTPPYISKVLIQHFGISNPSPRYVKTVATAFRTGSYIFKQAGLSDISFGENKWGDLAATTAAILLDREARAVAVESDPLHGSIREPMNKVIAVMRAMGYTRAENSKLKYPILAFGLQEKIGQMPHEAPGVFSFFDQGYQPAGAFSQASLVSPESQVLSMITVAGMSNGLSALIKNGMSRCDNGFGSWLPIGYSCDYPVGRLTYLPSVAANSAEKVIDELSLLLTSGRLSAENKAVILQYYNTALASDTPEKALKVAQHLILASPEFQTSNTVRKSGAQREPSSSSGSTAEPYKAIINVHLFGGMDSFYMLSPHSTCPLYTEYNDIRGEDATLKPADMDSLDATSSTDQPCQRFGLHKNLAVMKELYDSDMGLFMANTGHLEKPVTKHNYFSETRAQLFAHNSMENEAAYVDGYRENVGTGVLGRMLDVLQQKNYGVSAVAIDSHGPVLDGNAKFGRPVDVISRSGVDTVYDDVGSPSDALTDDEMKDAFRTLNGDVKSNSGKYADHWSQAFVDGIDKAASLKAAIDNVTLTHEGLFSNKLGDSLKMIAKLIKAREERGVNRDAFHVRLGGWDHHAGLKGNIEPMFLDVNAALNAFKKEMETLGLMDQITLVVSSEFARTLSPNSGAGTDHAWGGNYFMMGGQVNGGKILGEYPKGFTEKDPTNDGRGRLVPTTSWESIWNGVAQWYGINVEDDLDYVLPNRGNFGCRLLTEKDLYKQGTQTNLGCGGDIIEINQALVLDEARYLSGEEQKELCDLITSVAVAAAPGYLFRCIILDQRIETIADTSCNHQLNLRTELSTDGVGVTAAVTQEINTRSQEIVNNLISDSLVTGICGLGDSGTAETKASRYPTKMPSRPPTGYLRH